MHSGRHAVGKTPAARIGEVTCKQTLNRQGRCPRGLAAMQQQSATYSSPIYAMLCLESSGGAVTSYRMGHGRDDGVQLAPADAALLRPGISQAEPAAQGSS